jgi:hypothetical protein
MPKKMPPSGLLTALAAADIIMWSCQPKLIGSDSIAFCFIGRNEILLEQ